MLRTIVVLIATIIVLPLVALKFDPAPLHPLQWEMLQTSAIIMCVIALFSFIVAELSNNYSQTDKLWSITPIIFTWYFAFKSGCDARVVLMAVCVTIWGARLTYNFGRKGAYRLKFWEGEEDYRWKVLRNNTMFKGKPMRWRLFNFFFIAFYQIILTWLFTLPAIFAFTQERKPLFWADYLLAALYIGLVAVETVADQQQWDFQQGKKRQLQSGKLQGEYASGFVHRGLWRLSRHPNYAAEQSIWVVFYFFSIAASDHWINASMAGCLLLLILFQGSADFSEEISASKYPDYKDYQKQVGKFLPKLF